MNTRPLTDAESANLAALNEAGLKSVPLFVTATGLRKSIFDATEPMRALFRDAGFHDYDQQAQGPGNKVVKSAVILDDAGAHEMSISLYRPVTKQGDPRLWPYEFKRHARTDDVVALFFHASRLYAANLTRTNIAAARDQSPVGLFLAPFRRAAFSVASELLSLLRGIAATGPIRATCEGDTAIGRSIETALGIPINSSRNPDFKGIELKSGRSELLRKETRATLFACVPDWQLSALKSSAQILERFGYPRGNDFKLYCTISSRGPNSQGLQLEIDKAARWLREIAARQPEEQVAIWRMERLEERLAAKHHETFWIKAHAEKRSDGEWFHLQSVTHTRDPNVPQLARMLSDGGVTLDHLIKRTPGGRVTEKGPLFKIARGRIPELFLGVPRIHSLT